MVNTFILDTNLFFNLQSGLTWGKNSKDVIDEFVRLGGALVHAKKASFYMTPGIVEEFNTFYPEQPSFMREFLNIMAIKSPNTSQSVIGARVVCELVEEARARAYRGMKVAEEEIDQAAKSMIGAQMTAGSVEYQKNLGVVVTKFRERYRHATRFNFLDSVVDLELILLAKELNGALVSADEGVVRWGRLIGVGEISPGQLRSALEALQ